MYNQLYRLAEVLLVLGHTDMIGREGLVPELGHDDEGEVPVCGLLTSRVFWEIASPCPDI